MKHDNVNCNRCGAPFQVAAHVNFVTCGKCQTPLVVRRSGTATYTERAEQPTDIATPDRKSSAPPAMPGSANARSDELAELKRQNELNRLENELNRLDLDWDREKEKYKVWHRAGRHGHSYQTLPTKGGSMAGGIITVVIGTIWMIFAFGVTTGFTFRISGDNFGPPPIVQILFPLFGLVVIIIGIISSIAAYNKAEKYEKAVARYERQRNEVLDEIDELQMRS